MIGLGLALVSSWLGGSCACLCGGLVCRCLQFGVGLGGLRLVFAVVDSYACGGFAIVSLCCLRGFVV